MKKLFLLLLTLLISQKNLTCSLYSYQDSGFELLDQIFGDSQHEEIDIENKQYHGIYENWFVNNFDKQIALNDNIHPAILNKILKFYLNKYIDNSYKETLGDLGKTVFSKDIISATDSKKPINFFEYKSIFECNNNIGSLDLNRCNKNSKFHCIGDIHSRYTQTLQEIIAWLIFKEILGHNLKLKDDCFLIFQGDYTDRGKQGLSVIAAIILLHLFNPGRVFIIKGNHETLEFLYNQQKDPESVMVEALKLTNYDEDNANLILNHLEIIYLTLPDYITVKNPKAKNKNLLICHGDEKSAWNDVYPEKYFDLLDDNDRASIPSPRGCDFIIRNAKFVIDELSKSGYSAIAKSHDHTVSKDPDRKICKWGIIKETENETIKYSTPSIGAINIGIPKKFPVIVNIAGPIGPMIKYFPTIVEFTPRQASKSGWKINAINCATRN